MYIRMYVHTRLYKHICTLLYPNMHANTYIHAYVQGMYVHVYVLVMYVYVCKYVCTCDVCVCMYMCMYL